MNLEKLKDTARKFEQKEDWRKAIEVYLKAIQQIESGTESTPDLSLYNRVGDLHLKTNDTAAAVRSYERAVDLYADQGFFNNAIALCGKILRVNPGRTQTYLKLAQLHARKNVVIEAKRNLIEFLERMNGLGQLDQAFQSIKEFADQFSGSQEIRMMLVELLRAASREDEAREQMEKLMGDLGSRADRGGALATPERPRPAEPIERSHDRVAPRRPGDLVFLDTGMQVPTSPPVRAADTPIPGPVQAPPPEGLIVTGSAYAPPIEDAELLIDPLSPPPGAEPLPGLERTAELEMDAEGSIVIDPSLELERTEPAELEFEGVPLDGMEDQSPTEIDAEAMEGLLDSQDDLVVSLSATETDLLVTDELADSVDLDFVDPGAPDTPAAGLPLIAVEESPSASLAELENRVLDDPDDPDLHRNLGQRLVTDGETTRAEEELLLALGGYEQREDWRAAAAMADYLVALTPDEIGHHQKRVELAFRMGEREPLLSAYLSLGDALARLGATDKAVAVYGRVQEHDPGNAHAKSALAALTAAPEPPRAAPRPFTAPVRPAGAPSAPVSAAPVEPPAPAQPTPASGASFIDFGSLVLDESGPRDTRMRIDRREPEDEDEQREFHEILEQFKRGIEQNLDTDDYEAHYDLGIAFKEMGLLDEAIAEFQKALRAPEGRLRTSEALGISFFDKGQYAISETVLRRAVDTLEGGDEAKIGLLYWLGRAAEAQGKQREAIASYERALAVDIRFMDLSQRIRRLTAERRS